MRLKRVNYVLLAILLVFLSLIFYQSLSNFSMEGMLIGRFLNEGDYLMVYPWMDGENLYLIDGCDSLVMSVSPEQAISIEYALSGFSPPRPLTHDLVDDMFGLFGIRVVMVTVEDMEDGAYKARLFLVQGNRALNLDSRPSDAVAIAIRQDKPIFVRKELMETHGKGIC